MSLTDEIDDFCRAVLADNHPRTGEPFDAIYRWIGLARKRAHAAGFAQGIVTASADETRSGSVERSEIEPGPPTADAP